MSHVQIPDSLIQQIEAAGLTGGAVDEFVQQAVRQKLKDFEKQRRSEVGQAADDFDALCDATAVSALGTHLTRDQLHERD